MDLVAHEALCAREEDSSNIVRLTALKGGHFLKILCTQKSGVVKEGINVVSRKQDIPTSHVFEYLVSNCQGYFVGVVESL